LEPLLAVPKLKPIVRPSQGGNVDVSASDQTCSDSKPGLNLEASEEFSGALDTEYVQLQLRIFKMAIVFTVFSVLICAIFIDIHFSISLLIGALSGILYLRLLARGIGKLGKTSMSVSKVQLLVPVLLFFLASRFPELELLPALLGFLIYKLSLIVQFLLEP